MTLLMVVAALYGVVQLTLIAWPTRSVRLSTVLLAVLVGAYVCGTAAALVELAYTRAVVGLSGHSLVEMVNTTAYTTAPWVEELLKAAPLLLMGLYAKVRRQWGLTDFTVLGAALGAGFGLLEALLRYSLDADRALARHGGWLIPDSLSPPYVPGPGEVFTSWLPSPAATLDLGRTGEVAVPTFTHLTWTTLAGLAAGVLWRAPRGAKPLAAIPFAAAVAHHTLNNYAAGHPGGEAREWFETLNGTLWAVPLLALLLAMTADLVRLYRGKRTLPGVLLAGERSDGDAVATLVRYASWRLPWTPLIALRFVRLRRALCYAAPATPSDTLESLRRPVAELAARIDETDQAPSWRTADIRARIRAARRDRARRRRQLLSLIPCVLVLPSVLFLGVGSFKSTAELQDYFTSATGLRILQAFAVAALAWTLCLLTLLLRTWRHATLHPLAEQLATHRLRFTSALTSATTGTLLLWRSTGPSGLNGRVIPNAHLLEALDHFLTYLGFSLFLLSLLALFPPGAGLVLAGSGAVGGVAGGSLLAALRLGIAGIALMSAGAADGAAADGDGRPGESGRGDSRSGSIDESEKVFNPKERRIAEALQSEGRNVRALKESQVDGRKTPDAVVDGVLTEFKTLDPGAAPNSVKNTLNTAKKQARDAVIDARGSGLDEGGAREGLGKFLRNNPPGRMNSIRIIGDGYNISWP
ncbi:PrsW family glutamic-type intramembrane protease [Streptomyces sp. YU58]|uniref:CdiA C-terminal domain-containing protein n=1 Tax=Streptomyces sp. SX92 TaxID=3158972 RepID=UPI0027B9F470|nr:PrsW family glutamic-type intramembrane protease [Streptomyces coralus]WLW52525.1 PrsW family glutamic-type intramembrane protease [Streptomyces coralus]